MSAKELGQIHTVNTSININATQAQINLPTVPVGHIDLPGELTNQLSRMVRQGNYFKVVGIDMSIDVQGDDSRYGIVSGFLRYYAPTKGRCIAWRSAFKSMAEQMKIQGINMRDNHLYDFRAPLSQPPTGTISYTFRNQATLNGTNGLYMGTGSTEGCSIFGVHNTSVRPVYEGTNVFGEGFKTLLDDGGSRTDFVLNDTALYSGNEDYANLNYEKIPFQLYFSTTNDEAATATFQFRPDPALYLAVMCGQFEVILEDVELNGFPTEPLNDIELNFAIQVSGWKSIMGNPDTKKKRKGRK